MTPETKFKRNVVTPWLEEQGIWCMKPPYFQHDYLVCINGRLVILEAKAAKNSARQPSQIRDSKSLPKAGGVWIWAYPENWDKVKKQLLELKGV